jgi:hypothetical protein
LIYIYAFINTTSLMKHDGNIRRTSSSSRNLVDPFNRREVDMVRGGDFYDDLPLRPFEPVSTVFDREPQQQLPGMSRTVHFDDPYSPQSILKKQQPLYSTPTRIVISQPTNEAWDYEYQWHTGLSQCCTDLGQCCYAWFCICCFVSDQWSQFIFIFLFKKKKNL